MKLKLIIYLLALLMEAMGTRYLMNQRSRTLEDRFRYSERKVKEKWKDAFR